jgi:long-subunit acyl-CoA synthetase (AMP-forming)
MKLDPRLVDIDRTADDREPTEVYADQMAVIVDNLMHGYFSDPQRTDAMLRRDGMTKTADRLAELFGPNWWTRLHGSPD